MIEFAETELREGIPVGGRCAYMMIHFAVRRSSFGQSPPTSGRADSGDTCTTKSSERVPVFGKGEGRRRVRLER